MSTPSQATLEELRVAEIAVTLVETRIRERMERCEYAESGPRAYENAERAVAAAFRDVFDSFRRIRHGITKQGGGS